jgi:glycosyltransferase involved in cell wall biosynthesis
MKAHEMTSVDVLVPCYRYGRYLRKCVESALTQSGVDVRVLIIDDASPDDTAEVAADLVGADTRVSFIRHTVNKGHIATYNEGIEWASKDYFLLLSADDYLLPDALKRATELMEEAPEVGFTFGNALVLQDSGAFEARRPFGARTHKGASHTMTGLEFISHCGATNIVPTPTAVVRTSVQKRAGGYRPELTHSGDYEMWLRLAALAGVGFVDADQAVYRVHQNNMSRSYMAEMMPDIEQRKLALEFFFKNASFKAAQEQELRARLFGGLARDTMKRASMCFNEGRQEISTQLSDLALELYPPVGRSWPRIKLGVKRSIGLKAWQAMQSARRGIGRRGLRKAD